VLSTGEALNAGPARPTRGRPLRWTSLSVPGRAQETIREMGAIVQAIEAKDADAAAAACAAHVRNAAATALARMAESAEPLGQAR
jgi:DNA-binding GntR family transcriptional regulator